MNSRKILSIVFLLVAVVASLVLYREHNSVRVATVSAAAGAMPIGAPVEIKAPLGLPPVPIPADNPPTAETIALGRRLYYDPMLSSDNSISCATCHSPDHGFADPKSVSIGVGGKPGGRNSPTVLNSAYFKVQFWDGRSPDLEHQAEGPVENPVEMANTLAAVEQRLNADPSYKAQFEKAWGPGPITYEKVEKSIASFERTVISANSPFDRWKYGHDEKAMSSSAKRGFVVFSSKNKGNCTACHLVGEKDALFTDNKFHDIGVGVDMGKITDPGLFAVTQQESDRGLFKTPSLRNIAQTAPYMHDGTLPDLKQVMDFYIGAGNSNPNMDKEIHALDFLSGAERADLLAFLNSLSGEMPANVGPPEKKMASAN
jgi:cytochrome c peroxidase